jgi:hypothetical protein
MTSLKEEIRSRIHRMQEEMDRVSPDLRNRFPISPYLHEVKAYPEYRTHGYFRRRRKDIFRKIDELYGPTTIALYHKLSMATFMEDALARRLPNGLPQGIVDHIHAWYARVLEDFDRQPDSYYDICRLDFKIDLGVCILKNLPVGGAWFVKIRSISPRVFLTFDLRRHRTILECILFETKGLYPYVAIHTVPRYMLRFTRQRMNLAYQEIGELMKVNPKIRGIFRRSWFLAPEMAQVTPSLTFLREVPEANGAIFFEGNTTRHEIANALSISPHRRRLYDEGEYHPTDHAYIWPRKAFLDWVNADKTGSENHPI